MKFGDIRTYIVWIWEDADGAEPGLRLVTLILPLFSVTGFNTVRFF